MATRNLTLNLPIDLIKKTKVRAAESGKTINAFVREVLEEKVLREKQSRAAALRFLELARRGPSSHVDPASIRREEAYERH